jgi:hypothetical protein
MANTTIVLKKSGVPGNVPSVLANGELSINFADGKLYYRAANGTITSISGSGGGGGSTYSFATVNANSSLILATSSTDTLSIIPGNGVSITANTTSKTIRIDSTANADVFSSNTVNTLSILANTANILTLNVINHVVTGNSNVASLSATNIFANNYYYANGVPLASGGGGGGGGNVSASGWTVNSVIVANSTGYLSSPANLSFITSNNTLLVTGNIVGGGVRTTSATTPPASPTTGDMWYNTSTDVMYRYTFDGTNYYWIDTVSSATASNGSLTQANVTFTTITANVVSNSVTSNTITANTISVLGNLTSNIITSNTINVTTVVSSTVNTTSLNTLSVYSNSYYFANGSPLVSGGGGSNAYADANSVIFINNNVISTNANIAANKGAMSVGPIYYAAGVTVNMAANSRWVIL